MSIQPLRKVIEQGLSITLEGDFGVPVELTAPDGSRQTLKHGTTEPLLGQMIYEDVKLNPDTGEEIVVAEPRLTLRISSLDRVPIPGERWFVRAPTSPHDFDAKSDFVSDATRSPEGGTSIGTITLFLTRAVQS